MSYFAVHEATAATLARHYREYAPVFVLSTGRTGTKFVAHLLDRVAGVEAWHEPFPVLMGFPRFARDHQDNLGLLQRMFDAARQERILAACVREQTYVEANQTLTFFAAAIQGLYPRARFVHLVRHPASFATSAMRRGYFDSDTIWRAGRPAPASGHGSDGASLDKCLWLWREVNAYLSAFGAVAGPESYRLYRAEDLWRDPAAVEALIDFVGGSCLPEAVIRQLQAQPVNALVPDRVLPDNVSRDPSFPDYANWPENDRQRLRDGCGELARQYGYDLTAPDVVPSRLGRAAPGLAAEGPAVPVTRQPARPGGHDSPTPLLSVLVTTRNSARYLPQCLQSVLDQTYGNIEVVVSDDASQDQTVELIHHYTRTCGDVVRSVFSDQSTGASGNRNRALQAARGVYITTLDGDDFYWDMGKLEREMALVLDQRRRLSVDAIGFSEVVFVDEAGGFLGRQWPTAMIAEVDIMDRLLAYDVMIPRDYVVCREAYTAIGGWREGLRTSNTWDVLLKLAARRPCLYSGLIGTAYRRHERSMTAGLPWLERTNDAWQVFYSNLYALVPEPERRAALELRFRGFMAQWDWELNDRAACLQQACQARAETIAQLQEVAAERLDLIGRLHQVAAERLELIERLQHECEARLALAERLQEVAEARQEVIAQLQQVVAERR